MSLKQRQAAHAAIHATLRDAYARSADPVELNTIVGRLWEQYPDLDKHGFINAVAQLYRLCPKGGRITCVYLGSTPAGQHRWEVFVSWNNETCRITGYMLEVGIGRETRDEHLSTSGYAADLAVQLGYFLYGYDRTDWLISQTY